MMQGGLARRQSRSGYDTERRRLRPDTENFLSCAAPRELVAQNMMVLGKMAKYTRITATSTIMSAGFSRCLPVLPLWATFTWRPSTSCLPYRCLQKFLTAGCMRGMPICALEARPCSGSRCLPA
jgi:hypothetical protein